ncbi:Alpha/Beta hydrolase protein [Xylariales sp. PMI_506]|nr:Alpha/Beta hydrolase protein [Xylariales sp. PMI_506]
MFVKSSVSLALLSLSLLKAVTASPKHLKSIIKNDDGDDDGCPKGVYIIGVRGTLEDPGFGALQGVVDDLLNRIPGSDSVAIDYPAGGITLNPEGEPVYNIIEYSISKTKGGSALDAVIQEFVYSCPDTGYVVLGYSQGAHVVGDVLCGVRVGIWPPRYPIDTYFTENLKAIIQLGDPTNVANLEWHAGNATHGGIFPRQSFDDCKNYGSEWKSYCDADDVFCDRGNSIPVHMGYVARYKDQIVDFVVEQVNKPKEPSNTFHYITSEDEL